MATSKATEPDRGVVVPAQKYSFNPNCTCLGEFACEVTLPNADDPTVRLGKPNCGRLRALKASARNSSMEPSRMGSANCLNSESAVVAVPGARTHAISREAFPTVKGGGVTR